VHPLKNGLPAFYQPTDAANFSQYQLPFPVNTTTEAAICMPAPTMEYFHDLAIWDGGRLDAWNTARDMGLGPAYFTRYDLPYYFALLDGFTVADQYFQSTFTCTNPNRAWGAGRGHARRTPLLPWRRWIGRERSCSLPLAGPPGSNRNALLFFCHRLPLSAGMHLFTGTTGLSVNKSTPVVDNTEPAAG
jgi:hypothetical protein